MCYFTLPLPLTMLRNTKLDMYVQYVILPCTDSNSKMTQSDVMLPLYNEMKGIRDDYDACTRLCKDFSSMVSGQKKELSDLKMKYEILNKLCARQRDEMKDERKK